MIMLYNEERQKLKMHPVIKNFLARVSFFIPTLDAVYLDIADCIPAQVRENASIRMGEVS